MLCLLLLLGLMIPLALSDAVANRVEPSYVGLGNYVSLVNSLLFRRSLGNTLVVVGLALLLAVPVAGVTRDLLTGSGRWSSGSDAGRHPSHTDPVNPGRNPGTVHTRVRDPRFLPWYSRRTELGRMVLILSCLLPLAMPAGFGVLAWRDVMGLLSLPMARPSVALVLLAVVHGWRAVPIALLALSAPIAHRYRTRYGLATAAATYWIVADVSVVMLLTAGEPYNGTHMLASWTYLTSVTGGSVGLGAAMALFVALCVPAIVLGRPAVKWDADALDDDDQQMESNLVASGLSHPGWTTRLLRRVWPRRLLTGAVLLWMLMPAAIVVWRAGRPLYWASTFAFLGKETAYFQWLLAWFGLAALVAVSAALVAPAVGRDLARRSRHRQVIERGLSVLVLSVLPVAFVPILWLQCRSPFPPTHVANGLLRLEWLYFVATVCLSLPFVAMVANKLKLDRVGELAAVGIIAWLLVTQDFGNAMALHSDAGQLVNIGVIERLAFRGDVEPSVIALAIALPTLISFVLCGALYWAAFGRETAERKSLPKSSVSFRQSRR